jgi:hypothetical protein
MSAPTYAQIAYEAYASHQDWKNYAGLPIPPWQEVRPDIQEAWHVAVTTVLDIDRGKPQEERR